LKDGSYVETKDLKYGNSLHILTKYQASLKEYFQNQIQEVQIIFG